MRHVNVTGPAFQPTMQSADNHVRDLRDEVAKIALNQVLIEVRERQHTPSMDFIAKRTWDFVDAFMRERYERESVARATMKPNFGTYQGNPISE